MGGASKMAFNFAQYRRSRADLRLVAIDLDPQVSATGKASFHLDFTLARLLVIVQ
jgi:cellulose biosynthesis protein BcsQ